MTEIIKLQYNIKDKVYHISPESELGIVVSWRVQYEGPVEYLVTWGPQFSGWYTALELSDTKTF